MRLIFVYSLFIVIISVIPVNAPEDLTPANADKVVHFLIYVIFVILYAFAFRGRRRIYMESFIYALCLGVSIEIIQYFIPYRSFEMLDIAADCAGALTGIAVIYKARKANILARR